MRLAFINPNRAHHYDAETPDTQPLGGSESAQIHLARALAARGHRVVLVTGVEAVTQAGGVETRPLPASPDRLGDFEALVILNDPAYAVLVRAVLGPQPVLIHWEQNLFEPSVPYRRALEALAGPRDLFAFLSDWQIAHYRAQGLALPADRTVKLRNAIAPAFENLFPQGRSILAAKRGPFRLAFTSAPYKGLEPALGFFQDPSLAGAELHLYTGFGHYAPNNIHRQSEARWQALYERSHATRGLVWHGLTAQPALAKALAAAHVLFYPSIVEETAGIAVMEAMAAGMAIVASDWGALAETTGGLATLLPVGRDGRGNFTLDGAAFAQAAARFGQRFQDGDPELEAHLRRQIDHIERHHLWSGRAREFEAMVAKALGGPAGGPTPRPESLFETAREFAQQGRTIEAKSAYRHVLALRPDYGEALNNLGLLHRQAGEPSEALTLFDQALARHPGQPQILTNRAGALAALGREDEALDNYRQALAAKPDDVAALNNLANLLKSLGRREESVLLYRQALALKPDAHETHLNLARLLVELGEERAAEESFAQTLALRPDWSEAAFTFALAQLEQLYDSEADIETRRARFDAILASLEAHYDRAPATERANAAGALVTLCPFFLAYQGKNDRDLQRRYGGLIHRLLAAAFPAHAQPIPNPKPNADGRLRLGIVSPFFRPHSIWKIPLRGWLEGLDQSRFDLTAYALDGAPVQLGETAALGAKVVAGTRALAGWIERIAQDRPHILLYPDIGMDGLAMKLAALRLAPLQATTLGHPDTTGLPTIDLFFSSALMEPEGAEDHYTETLVRLPGLGILYRPEPPIEGRLSRADLALPEGRVLYWCAQSLFKYTPAFDARLARIAARLPQAHFVFLEHHDNPRVTKRLRERLVRAFQAAGLAADGFLTFLPRLAPKDFARAARLMDVFLDHDAWSGFNSALEALAQDLPVLTLPGPLMRGRHATAILRLLDLEDLIAANEADWVERAVRLGADPAWRQSLRNDIAARRQRLYGDRRPIRAMEEALIARL